MNEGGHVKTCIGPELDDMSPGEVKLSNELSND
jgi:hypothetical protein